MAKTLPKFFRLLKSVTLPTCSTSKHGNVPAQRHLCQMICIFLKLRVTKLSMLYRMSNSGMIPITGGVQLQNFRSVGRQIHARAVTLRLQHGTEVHVTVVAENAAGLRTAIYSDPLTVDLTPPELCCLVVRCTDTRDYITFKLLMNIVVISLHRRFPCGMQASSCPLPYIVDSGGSSSSWFVVPLDLTFN